MPSPRTHRGPVHHFTTHQVAEAAGVSYRQVDYWIRTGVVRPTRAARGSGTRRSFSYQDVALVASVAELMRLGGTWEQAERLYLYLDALDVERWPDALVVTPTGIGDVGESGWYLALGPVVASVNAALLGATELMAV